MRKLGKIKLNQLSKDELDQRKMNALKGGCSCYDKCHGDCNSCGSSSFPATYDQWYDLNYPGSGSDFVY
ncbi:MAG: TIGR04149 family rSAM-modified RiPP [Dysgonamonadaceae bacterium]|nr:TIGR04149 family rSAM-modified RiPP [Dysgonamonadaceae bacterium]